MIVAGFLPQRRVSCPMDGAYLPQHVRRARADGRMLGQVRDLIVMRKPCSELELRQGLAAGELVHLAPDERVRQGGISAHDRLRE
jgi:ParB family chromosome partitioning protein